MLPMLDDINLENLEEVGEQLFTFVWEFRHGDNIMYNFEVLQELYKARNNSPNKDIYNKPITVTIVSIIEAILIDFLTRIDQATNHLPGNVDRETLDKIKLEIESKKRPVKVDDEVLGEQIYLRRKMYHFGEIVSVFEKYELFGSLEEGMYRKLRHFGDMRNRVHIENYHQNLESRENRVFTSRRLAELEDVLATLWDKMKSDYKRPWGPPVDWDT